MHFFFENPKIVLYMSPMKYPILGIENLLVEQPFKPISIFEKKLIHNLKIWIFVFFYVIFAQVSVYIVANMLGGSIFCFPHERQICIFLNLSNIVSKQLDTSKKRFEVVQAFLIPPHTIIQLILKNTLRWYFFRYCLKRKA